jgi:hypothetical protein
MQDNFAIKLFPHEVLSTTLITQGWKKPDFFPLENKVFGFNE